MSVLLDTHTFFWWITGSSSLPVAHGGGLASIDWTTGGVPRRRTGGGWARVTGGGAFEHRSF